MIDRACKTYIGSGKSEPKFVCLVNYDSGPCCKEQLFCVVNYYRISVINYGRVYRYDNKGVELEIRSETTKISEADTSVDYTWLTGQRTSSR